jgi:hypothetical protein
MKTAFCHTLPKHAKKHQKGAFFTQDLHKPSMLPFSLNTLYGGAKGVRNYGCQR